MRPIKSEVFFFCEKKSGETHFYITGVNGQFPVDQAAELLATHCAIRERTPNDYMVTTQVEDRILKNLQEKTEKLLRTEKSVHNQINLTRREKEVVSKVVKSLSNKEIGAELNISERTVKFHVSSLLSKFKVRGRMELAQKMSEQSKIILLPTVGS